MAAIDRTVIRVFEALFCVVFLYLVLVYGGVLLLLPLDLVVQMIRLLGFLFGEHAIVYTLVAVPVVAGLGYRIYRMPVLWSAVVETGMALVRLGYQQNRRFEAMLRAPDEAGAQEGSAHRSDRGERSH